MKAEFYDDINRFNELIFPFLVKYEAENNLPFSILNFLKEDLYKYGDDRPFFISITENDNIKLVSIRTPPHNQILSFTNDLETIKVLTDELIKKNIDIPGVLGFKEAAERFVKFWCKRKGIKNPISNSIYQKVGYRAVIDADEYQFIP